MGTGPSSGASQGRRGAPKPIVAAIASLLLATLAGFVLAMLLKTHIVEVNGLFIRQADVVGVDLSNHQGTVDMAALVEQGVQFVYIKATEGSSFVDPQFSGNWDDAARNGLAAGAYHFFSFDSSGATQADNFIRTVGDLEGALIPAVDVEYYADRRDNPPDRDDVVREFGAYVAALEERYGVRPLIYAPREVYDMYLAGSFDEYPRWVRSVYIPPWFETESNWLVWQYSDHGQLEGYDGGGRYIDLDVVNSDVGLEGLLMP